MQFIKKNKHIKLNKTYNNNNTITKFYTVLASKGRGSKQQHLWQLSKSHKTLFTQE